MDVTGDGVCGHDERRVECMNILARHRSLGMTDKRRDGDFGEAEIIRDAGEAVVKILTCHVVAGKVMAKAVMSMVKADGGSHTVKTVGGCMLTFKVDGKNVTVTDESGGVAKVTIADVMQSNGVIHVIDKVLLPKM